MKAEERICRLCKNDIEDEEHFMINCQKLNKIRDCCFQQMSNSYINFNLLNSKQKLIWLLSSEDKIVMSAVGKLVINLFKERNTLLCEGVASLASKV